VVAGDTGILLNNRAGRGFTLQQGHPNRLAGGRRPMHTLTTYLVASGGRPVLVGGTPGGDLGLQWNVQVLVGILDHGLDPQTAIESPRWHSTPGTELALRERPRLQLEDRFSTVVLDGLRRRGHAVRLLPPWGAASAYQMIALDHERGTLLGATDPRAEGIALGL
jgi:gamma-glutamyltranspeptidase/glutathione hydrolase